MLTFLIALRDALVALALAWVGYSLSPAAPQAPTTPRAAPACPTAAPGQLCNQTRPGFNALDCGND